MKYLLYQYAEIPTRQLELPKITYCYKQNLNVLEGTNEPAINLLTSKSNHSQNAYSMSLATETHTLVSTESSDSDHDYISN